MFQKVVVKNFQKHKDLEVVFSPEVTCVCGDSDVGKSSLLRALRLVCLNRPSGVSYVRKGSSLCVVRLHLDGHCVARLRADDTNLYKLDGKDFRAFGNEVPQEIQDLLQVDEASFQMQADPHFWFGDSAGSVSKSLNEVVNLQAIDKALSFISEEVRHARTDRVNAENYQEECRKKRKSLKWVVGFEKDLKAVEDSKEDFDSKGVLRASLAGMIVEATQTRKELGGLSEATTEGEKVVELGFKASAANARKWHLENLIIQAKKARRTCKIEVPDIGEVLAVRREGDIIAERRRYLEAIVEEAREAKLTLRSLRDELQVAEAKLKEKERQVPICPACLRPLPSSVPICTSGHQSPLHGKRKAGTT